MNLTNFIARRYFFSKNSSNAVNIISGISVVGILVGAASLVIVLSAFNGLEKMVRSLYNEFDPDLKITVQKGKFFDPTEVKPLLQNEEVRYSEVLEERALLSFSSKEYIATLKGVDQKFAETNDLQDNLLRGEFSLQNPKLTPATLGAGVAYYLDFSRSAFGRPVSVFVPREYSGMDPSQSFSSAKIYPRGVFSIQPSYDEKYVIVNLEFVQQLINRPGQVSALEIDVLHQERIPDIQRMLQQKLGSRYSVKNRDEQQAVFFKVMQTEGLFTFLVFALILSIATFTIAGSLTMLMLEKKQNLFSYWALGMPLTQMRQIFFKEGLLISLVGGLVGIGLGVLVVFLQDTVGLVRVGAGYSIDAYPVQLKVTDLFLVAATVLGLSAITSWLTARRISLRMIQRG